MVSKIFKLLAFAALCLLFLPAPGRGQQGFVNPHSREGCIACHKAAVTDPHKGTLLFSPDQEGPHAVIAHSCKTCHKEGKDNFWIIVLTPGQGRVSGRAVPGAASPPPTEGQEMGGDDEGFANSHDSLECAKCHERDPGSMKGRLAEPFPFGAKGVGGFCRTCHDKVDQGHFPRGNRPRKSLNCLSCHQVHGSSLLFPSLRDDYPVLLVDSRDLNPHGGKIFCLSCHKDSPQGGQAVNFREPGRPNAMCQRCHNEVEHHPLSVKSSQGTWKMDFSDFPLQDESVTCVTCHDPYECDNVVTKDNPRFLRGGPYNTVEDFCTRCHEGRSFASLNPHDQIDDSGNVRKKQCLYCHTSVPEEGFDLGPQDFTDDLEALCASCHPVSPHPDVNHLVELAAGMEQDIRQYEEKRLVKLPLIRGNVITCVTCHNSHERGLLRGPAGVGADEEKRLRLATFNEICTPCHGRH